MKLGTAIQHFQAACQQHGIPGDTREGKGRYYCRLKGKRVLTFEFRPYRWVFFRFVREDFVREADPEEVTKPASANEPGPSPCAIFTGTLPADDEALLKLLDRFVAAVASGRLTPVKAAESGETAESSDSPT